MSLSEKKSADPKAWSVKGAVNSTKKEDDTYKDSDADVVLISSDDVTFRVHRYVLQAVSPVFRTMIQSAPTGQLCPEAQTVPFTDEKLERATVLKLLLHLATSTPIGKFNDIPYDDIIDLIRLCDKYDCATPLKLIASCIESPAEAVNLYHKFFYACALDDTEAAYRYFIVAAATSWPVSVSTADVTVLESFGGSAGLDVTGMSSLWIDRLPRKHFLALLRASRLRLHTPPASWQSVADEYKKQVLLQEPKKAPIAA